MRACCKPSVLGARCDSEQPIRSRFRVLFTRAKSSSVTPSRASLCRLLEFAHAVEGVAAGSRVVFSKPYVNLTLSMIRRAGGDCSRRDARCNHLYDSRWASMDCDRIVVEGDWSTAAFPVAASIASGKAVTLMGLNALSVQADRALENILGTLGHRTEWREGMFEVIPGTPRAQKIEIDLADCPDLFPALCTVAALQGGGVSLRGAPQLRLKESDRISLMAEGLRAVGSSVTEFSDGVHIASGPTVPR